MEQSDFLKKIINTNVTKEQIKEMIDNGASPHKEAPFFKSVNGDDIFASPIIIASTYSKDRVQIDKIKLLLDYDINVNSVNDTGENILTSLINSEFSSSFNSEYRINLEDFIYITDKLIEKGFNINNGDSISTLIKAISTGRMDIALYLWDNRERLNMDIEFKTKNDENALYYLIDSAFYEEINEEDENYIRFKKEREDLFFQLIKEPKLFLVTPVKSFPSTYFIANFAKKDMERICERLKKEIGLDLNQKSEKGGNNIFNTLFDIINYDPELYKSFAGIVVKYLIKNNVDYNNKNEKGSYPDIENVIKNNKDIAEIFINIEKQKINDNLNINKESKLNKKRI